MLAAVVDDHDMGVTHVIRGDDHLNNAFRQLPIYQAMNKDRGNGLPRPTLMYHQFMVQMAQKCLNDDVDTRLILIEMIMEYFLRLFSTTFSY